MARNMYGATSADFTLTSGGRVVPGSVLTIWSARTGGIQITDLLDAASVACTTVTSGADASVVYFGPNNDKTVHWADSGQGSRVAIRPVDITGDPPVLSIGTVGTGTAAATLTGTSEAPVLNLTIPSAGANGVNTAAIQDGAVTSAKIADGTIVSGDVAAGTFAAFGTVGNLLTANQATGTDTLGDTTGFTAWSAATVSTSTDTSLSGLRCLKVTATDTTPTAGIAGAGDYTAAAIPVTGGQTYTLRFDAVTAGPTGNLIARIYWWTAGGAAATTASSTGPATLAGSTWRIVSVTAQAPADAAFASFLFGNTGSYPPLWAINDAIYCDNFSFHRGAGGIWALPGTPIVGQSPIASNGAVHLSGTGAPEGVVTAAPGSSYLQTDATTDVKGWLRWVKATGTGTTGWVAGPEADTGRRALTLLNGWTIAGGIHLRRVGNRVDLLIANISSASATADEFYSLPSGFRPTDLVVALGVVSGTTGALFIAEAGGSVHSSDRVGTYFGQFTWLTNDAWPTSLPGSAA